ncbi:oligosaccharide repeat unit polymerase [Paenibacillus sp. H1-7]|uniref:oligosaccharide repeat unit polymerase n=1 Tax=Paenibacillus sp. H1-7 TaxID=2282849 RepID=UPI0031F3183C
MDFFVVASYLVIGLLSIYNIVSSLKYEFSLYKIHGYFFLIFMFLAPLYQYSIQSFPWGGIMEDELIIKVNILIICWQFIYIISYLLTSKVKHEGVSLPVNNMVILVGFLFTIVSSVITVITVGGISNLFSRVDTYQMVNQTETLFLSKSVRPIPIIYLGYLYTLISNCDKKNEKMLRVLFYLVLIIGIATNFPTAVSRYHAAAVYIGIILIFIKRKLSFDILFLTGFIFVFPTLELFRHSSLMEVLDNFSWQIIDFSTAHFDAYSMILRVVIYISNEGITYGKQLLGAILFFVPRTMWPSKPVGTGMFVGESLGLPFLNISAPIVSEGIINFGLIATFWVPVFIGYFTKKIDSRYWLFSSTARYINVYYVFLIGFFFFILRGDFLSSYSYTVAFLFPLVVLFVFSKVKSLK